MTSQGMPLDEPDMPLDEDTATTEDHGSPSNPPDVEPTLDDIKCTLDDVKRALDDIFLSLKLDGAYHRGFMEGTMAAAGRAPDQRAATPQPGGRNSGGKSARTPLLVISVLLVAGATAAVGGLAAAGVLSLIPAAAAMAVLVAVFINIIRPDL
jgi:hypothetical protein